MVSLSACVFQCRHIHHRIRAGAGGGLRGKLLEGVQDHLQGAGLQLHAGDLHDAPGEKVRRAEPSIVRATSVVRGALARARDRVQNLVRVGVQHDLLPGGSIEVPMCPVIPSLNSEVYRAGLRCEPQASRNFFALLLPSFANSIHATWDPAFLPIPLQPLHP